MNDFETLVETTPWWEMLYETGMNTSDKTSLVAIHEELQKITGLERCFEKPAYEG